MGTTAGGVGWMIGRAMKGSRIMSSSGFLASLNLGTLVIVFLVVAIGFVYFLRRRANRHPLEGRQERNVAEDLDAGRDPPDHSPRR